MAAAAVVNPEEIKQKLDEYSVFLRDVLRPDHEALLRLEQETRNEIAEYEDLRTRLNDLQSGGVDAVDGVDVDARNGVAAAANVVVDLGHQKVFSRATIDDTSRVFVHVGMGFHVELTVAEEALVYVQKRIAFLTRTVLPHRAAKSKAVLAHVQSTELILDQLSNELRRRRR